MPLINKRGLQLPTSIVLDIGDLKTTDVNSTDFKELIIRLVQFISNMATVVNLKDTGIYDTNEFKTNKMYFPDAGLTSQTAQTPVRRESYREVIVFPTLNNGVTANQKVHNIPFNSGYTMTVMNGVITNSTTKTYYPLCYAAAAGKIFSLWADGTYVYIDSNSFDLSVGYSAIVVIEYLKF